MPDGLTPATLKTIVVARDLVTVHVVAPMVPHPPPVQRYEVGWFVQFAVMVALLPMAMGELGLTVGAHTGVPAVEVRQVSVCDGAAPDTANPVQPEFV